jgi:hypothetical protein
VSQDLQRSGPDDDLYSAVPNCGAELPGRISAMGGSYHTSYEPKRGIIQTLM